MNKQIFFIALFLLPLLVIGQPKSHNPYSNKTPTYNNYNQNSTSNNITHIPTAPPTPPAPIPIDGGIGFLIAAGVGYGIRELKKNKK